METLYISDSFKTKGLEDCFSYSQKQFKLSSKLNWKKDNFGYYAAELSSLINIPSSIKLPNEYWHFFKEEVYIEKINGSYLVSSSLWDIIYLPRVTGENNSFKSLSEAKRYALKLATDMYDLAYGTTFKII